MEKNLEISRAVRLMGGPVSAAKKLSVPNFQTIQAWERAGRVPPKYCPAIEEQTGVSRAMLRPDDYWLIWPDLPAPNQEPAHA